MTTTPGPPAAHQPPAAARSVAAEAVSWLARSGGLAARLPRGTTPDEVTLSSSHEEFSLGLDDLLQGRDLRAAASTGWRHLVVHAGVPVASAATAVAASPTTPADEDTHTFRQLDYGPFVAGTSAALAAAEKATPAAHLRILEIPALYFVGVWSQASDGTTTIVPAAPAPPGIEADRPYPGEELLGVLRQRAATVAAESVDDGRGA